MFVKYLLIVAFASLTYCKEEHGHATSFANVKNYVHGSEPVEVDGDHHGKEKKVDYFAPAHYEFEYGVKDPHTKDTKKQEESRKEHEVTGQYKIKEADGTIRIVKYNADKHDGFNAEVQRIGHAIHPQHYKTFDDNGHPHEH